MARPRKHDGRLFRKEESKFWWMDYRDRDGKRQRESTNTDDWDEAQKRLRERLQARDGNTLPLLRKGEQFTFAQWSEHFLEAFSKPPIRAPKTHLSYTRVAKHLNAGFGEVLLVDLTADVIETYLRRRLEQRVQITRSEGKVAKGLVKPSTVHQEFRVLAADVECRRAQEAIGGESVFWGGVPGPGERAFPAALHDVVGAGDDRGAAPDYLQQCDPYHHGNGPAGI